MISRICAFSQGKSDTLRMKYNFSFGNLYKNVCNVALISFTSMVFNPPTVKHCKVSPNSANISITKMEKIQVIVLGECSAKVSSDEEMHSLSSTFVVKNSEELLWIKNN